MRHDPGHRGRELLLLLSRSVMSDSVRPQRRQPTMLHRPWDSPAKNTGVDCHFLLQRMKVKSESKVSRVRSWEISPQEAAMKEMHSPT